jgi:hypothetical protein
MMDTKDLFLEIKQPGHDANHSLPFMAEVKMVELYLNSTIRLKNVVFN